VEIQAAITAKYAIRFSRLDMKWMVGQSRFIK
jgi:hypothetical protein